MAAETNIEWCDATFNPWIGCTRVSPACDDCYAARSTPARTLGVAWGPGAPRRRTAADNWAQVKRWAKTLPAKLGRRPRVFCASLADVFDNEVPEAWRVDLFQLIDSTPELDWLLLTKRIGNAHEFIGRALIALATRQGRGPTDLLPSWPWPNVWLGATVVNQAEADRDVPKLLATPARVRFLSIEPMLGRVDVSFAMPWRTTQDQLLNRSLDWVICGGESGPKARPMHPDWARGLRDQCEAAGVPFLFKQWGEWKPVSQVTEAESSGLYRSKRKALPHEDQATIDDICGMTCTVDRKVVHPDGSVHEILDCGAWTAGAMMVYRVGKKAAGRLLEGREHNGFPEVMP